MSFLFKFIKLQKAPKLINELILLSQNATIMKSLVAQTVSLDFDLVKPLLLELNKYTFKGVELTNEVINYKINHKLPRPIPVGLHPEIERYFRVIVENNLSVQELQLFMYHLAETYATANPEMTTVYQALCRTERKRITRHSATTLFVETTDEELKLMKKEKHRITPVKPEIGEPLSRQMVQEQSQRLEELDRELTEALWQ